MPANDDQAAQIAGLESLAPYFHNQIHSEENVELARAHFGGHPTDEQLAQYFWLHGDPVKRREALSVIKKVMPRPRDDTTPIVTIL